LFQTVEKALWAFSTRGLHDACSAAVVMTSAISDAHVAANDGFRFFPAMRGGNSERGFFDINIFFDKLKQS